MVPGASSSMPMTNVYTIVGDYMSTTNGAVKKMDNIIEGVVLVDLGTTKGDHVLLLWSQINRLLMICQCYAQYVCFT